MTLSNTTKPRIAQPLADIGKLLFSKATILTLLVYPWTFLVSRRSKLWIFGSRRGFADNSKYLYLWLSANRHDITAIWLTTDNDLCALLRSHGYKSESTHSIRGILAALFGKVHCSHDSIRELNFALSGGCVYVNLWHAIGLKRFFYDAAVSLEVTIDPYRHFWPLRWALAQFFREPDVLVTTSAFMSRYFSASARIPQSKCPELGYPRLDVLVDEDLRLRAFALGDYDSILEKVKGFSKVYLYMPTKRSDGASFVSEALPDFDKLSSALRKQNAFLYIKLHRHTAEGIKTQHTNIGILPQGLDIYLILFSIDALITDYSSILYDFILSKDNGVILYTFDLDNYLKTAGLAYPFDENVIGVRANTFDELCSAIENGSAFDPFPAEKLRELRTKFWGDATPPSSARIVSFLENVINSGGSSSAAGSKD